MTDTEEQRFCHKLEKSVTETHDMRQALKKLAFQWAHAITLNEGLGEEEWQ